MDEHAEIEGGVQKTMIDCQWQDGCRDSPFAGCMAAVYLISGIVTGAVFGGLITFWVCREWL